GGARGITRSDDRVTAREPQADAGARHAARGERRGPLRSRGTRRRDRPSGRRGPAAAMTWRALLVVIVVVTASSCTRARITLGRPVLPGDAAAIVPGLPKAAV